MFSSMFALGNGFILIVDDDDMYNISKEVSCIHLTPLSNSKISKN